MKLTLSSDNNLGYTSVSNIFIEEYVPSANGEFVKVYLYLLHMLNNRNTNGTLTISSIADTFNQTETDIMRALRYWDKLGILRLSFEGPDKTLSDIEFREPGEVDQTKSEAGTATGRETSTIVTPVKVDMTVNYSDIANTTSGRSCCDSNNTPNDNISPEKLNELAEDEEFKMLLYVVQTYLGKPLTDKETSSIVYFYDGLHFDVELIEYLFEYCLSKGKSNMRYIEKVALSWAENGITSAQAAKEETTNYNESVYSVMKAFGLNNRNPAPGEKDFINKWTDSYCFDLDIIIEACNRTMDTIHAPSFDYTDKILTNWKNANVRTIQDIQKVDADYKSTKPSKVKATNTTARNSNNRFNNFQQRDNKTADYYTSLLSNTK